MHSSRLHDIRIASDKARDLISADYHHGQTTDHLTLTLMAISTTKFNDKSYRYYEDHDNT